MNFKIVGNGDCPLVQVNLKKGEQVLIERGAMAYMADVTLEGKMNAKQGGIGGFLSAVGRSIASGESMFITTATSESDAGILGVAPSLPGKVHALEVGDKQYRLNTGAFLACDMSVNYSMVKQDVGKAIFGGTGGLFVMETEGKGNLLVNSYGEIIELEVKEGHPISIDNDHVVAWDKNLDYKIEVASGTFGFKTGEGLVNKFTGTGKVLIQTRNLSALADEIRKYIPTQSSSSD